MASSTKEGRDTVNDFLEFLNVSHTAFHAVEEVGRSLQTKGFEKLNERESWKIVPGGKYFFTRNGSTIVAFAVGEKYEPGNGVIMVGAHTDSPCLKLKPVSKVSKCGYNQYVVLFFLFETTTTTHEHTKTSESVFNVMVVVSGRLGSIVILPLRDVCS